MSSEPNNTTSNDSPARAVTAFKDVVTVSNLILAPAAIFSSIFRLPEILSQIVARPIVSLSIGFLLVLIFVLAFWRPKVSLPRLALMSVVRGLAVVLSTMAIGILIFWIIISFSNGIHFVIIQSAPDRAAAVAEVQRINTAASQRDLDFRARYYASGGDNPWYSIVLGGPHFSRQSAEETLLKARAAMPEYIRNDAWIRSYRLGG